MQRKIIIVLALICILLGGALALLLLRGQSRGPPVSLDQAEENASQPYRREIDCIDRVLGQRGLSSNDVGPAFARCRGSAASDETPEAGSDLPPPR